MRGVALVLGVLALSLSTSASAQTGDPAAAAELFAQGRTALLAGQYDLACAKLDESARLDPRVGTLINLAMCEERRGRLADALQRWDAAAALAHEQTDTREIYIADERAQLSPRVARITIRLRPDAPPGTHVRLDGALLSTADLGGTLPINPGEHSVTTMAPGRLDVLTAFAASEAQSQQILVDAGPLSSTAHESASRSRWSTPKTLAVGAAALAVAGIGIGSVFGAQAIAALHTPGCSGGFCDTSAEAQKQHDGLDAGNRATVAFVAAGVFAASAVVLWVTAPKAKAFARTMSIGFAPSLGGTIDGGGIHLRQVW